MENNMEHSKCTNCGRTLDDTTPYSSYTFAYFGQPLNEGELLCISCQLDKYAKANEETNRLDKLENTNL